MTNFCCQMRARFLITIVGEDETVPKPDNLVDFIDFERAGAQGQPVIVIRFCPFCAKPIGGTTRVADLGGESA